jgi:predicted nuclease with TOPRIM domain
MIRFIGLLILLVFFLSCTLSCTSGYIDDLENAYTYLKEENEELIEENIELKNKVDQLYGEIGKLEGQLQEMAYYEDLNNEMSKTIVNLCNYIWMMRPDLDDLGEFFTDTVILDYLDF